MASRQQLEDALIAAHEAGDTEAAQLFAQEIKSLASKRPHDPMNDPPLLPGEEGYDATPSPEPSALRGLRRYRDRLGAASDRVGLAKQLGPFGLDIGSLETAGTMITGGLFAPVLGTAESIVRGTSPEESFARYTYQPRTESGKAQLNYLGALASPLTDSGADIALGPIAASEAQVLRSASRLKPNQPQAPIPTTEELTKAARGAYKAGKETGVIVQPESYSAAVGKVRSMATEEGLDPTLHPRSTAVMRRLEAADGQPLTLQEAETLRKIALDAEDDLNPVTREPTPDARLAGKIVDELDDAIEELSVNSPARAMYARSRRSQLIDRMIHRAEIRAGAHFTQAGMEHALRQEFKNLALNPRRLRGLTPDQRAAVEKVAKGGAIENSLRTLGKFDPFGSVVSAVGSLGTSSLLTNMTGNPLGLALPVAGFLGKRAATRMTRRNVDKAREALVGRAPAEVPPIAAAAPAQPAAMAGDLMPRRTLSLPSPTIIAGTRSAPGTAYAREQMGMTPDVERAGALHPGVAREVLTRGASALPFRPMPGLLGDQRPTVIDPQGRVAANSDQLQSYLRETGQSAVNAAGHPSRPKEPAKRQTLTLPLLPAKPMIVDAAGRVAPNREALRDYLRSMGIGRTRNGRGAGLLGKEPSGGGLLGGSAADEVTMLEREANSRGLFEGKQTPDKLAAEAEWLSRYHAAQARAQTER